MSGRGRGRAQAYNQTDKKWRRERYAGRDPSEVVPGPSGLSSSRSNPNFSDERAEVQRPRSFAGGRREEEQYTSASSHPGSRRGDNVGATRSGDLGRSGGTSRGDSYRSGGSNRSGESGRRGDWSRSGDWPRSGDWGRSGGYGRSGDSGRHVESSRHGDSGRHEDTGRHADTGRHGDSGRHGDTGRRVDSGRGSEPSRNVSDSGRSSEGTRAAGRGSGRSEDSGRGSDADRKSGNSSRPAATTGASATTSTGARAPTASSSSGTRPPRTRKVPTEVLKTRPDMCGSKKGASGKEVTLQSNYFKIETKSNWVMYQYRVDFTPGEDQEFQKKGYLRQHVDVIGRAYIFDGSMLFSTKLLTEDDKPLVLMSVRDIDKVDIKIEIRCVQKVSYGSHIYLQVFNILVRRSLSYLKLQLVNRNYFDARAAIQLPQLNMEIWPGYVTSIKQHESSVLMCAELTNKIMRKDTARDLLLRCYKDTKDPQAFQQAVVGQIVLTDYNNKTYKIEDIEFDTTPLSTFLLKNRELITFIEYYERRYKIKIRDLKQPLLVARCTQPSYRDGIPSTCLLIPELCRMTGLDDNMSDNAKLKKTLSEFTRITPAERMERVINFNKRLQESAEVNREFELWDMKLSKNLLEVPARELPAETIIGGDGGKYSAGRGTDWIREVRSKPMLKTATVKEWAVVFPTFLGRDVEFFVDTLRKAAMGMNFRLPPPRMLGTASDRASLYLEAVEDLVARAKYDIVLFVFTNNRFDRYSAIKKKCCIDRGIQSQVILAKNLRGKGMSVATKVAIQLNCKLGGAPWSVEIPLQNVMVIGFDVCHDTRDKTKSYGAIVASMNNSLSSWYSISNHHTCGEEVSNGLAADIGKALMKYKQLNGCLPIRIFIYRDGVGEGQLNFVYEHEVKCIKTALSSVYGGEFWKMAFIVVSKRIHTRLFKGDTNPAAGTVIDDVITLPERYDFFLVSQNVNAGTVTPTNYNVISDNSGLKPDQIQRWTYKMSHLYYNWSGTVRVPAPCQYAHKLAFLVGQSLHHPFHTNLSDTLFFL